MILKYLIVFSEVIFQIDASYLKPYKNKNDICYPSFKLMSNRRQAIFLDFTEDEYFLHDPCLYKRAEGLSVTVFKYSGTLNVKQRNKPDAYTIFSPNVVLMTTHLPLHILYLPVMDAVLKSHRSYVFIMDTTNDDFYKCDNGKFSQQAFNYIEIFLNDLWHKYFMFYVVLEMPFACPNFFIVYGPEKKKSGWEIYNRTVVTVPVNNLEYFRKNFNSRYLTDGFPLRANIFERFPTSMDTCGNMHIYAKIDYNLTQNFCGQDAMVMQEIIQRLGFNVTFPEVDTSFNYGYYVTDYNVTGSLGQLLNDTFDISFNSRFVTQYLRGDLANEIKFLHHVAFDSICCVMKIPDYIPLWHYPYNAYNAQVWVVLLALLILVAVVAKISAVIKKKILLDAETLHFVDYITIGVFGWMLCPKKRLISITNATSLITCIIILSVYQSHINYLYTTMVRKPEVNTIQDLIDYGIEIFSSLSILGTIGGPEGLPVDISKVHLENYNMSILLSHDNYASLQRKSDVQLAISAFYTTSDGVPLMVVVNECFSSQYLSYIARNDFPFGYDITLLIVRLLEAGLPDAYYRWTKDSLPLILYKENVADPQPRPFYATKMEEQRLAYALLLAGYLVSTCTLVIEKWAWKRQNKVGN